LRVLVQQFDILETMDAQAFLDFRTHPFTIFPLQGAGLTEAVRLAGDFLAPASGFQSKQFRLLENTLGLRKEQRIQHSGCPYFQHLREEDQEDVLLREEKPTLLSHVGTWLEKVLERACADGGFDFADYMRKAIEQAAEHDRSAIHQYRARLGPEEERKRRAELDKKLEAHLRLFSAEEHAKLVSSGIRQLSFQATMSCVLVHSFRAEPAMAPIHAVLSHLVEIDELLAQWRHRHSLIVLRMLGTKSGTGGSSGHAYLTQVMARSRIFIDLCHAMHYLLPQHALPALPPSVQRRVASLA
jgi:tryptophan 2,3-dioxygenase